MAFAIQVELGTIDIPDGSITNKIISEFPYGGLTGNVKLKISDAEWVPDIVWLVPENHTIKQFKYTEQMTLPSELSLPGNCRTSLYHNTTLDKYAYKSTIQEDGSYCVVAIKGLYRIVVEY